MEGWNLAGEEPVFLEGRKKTQWLRAIRPSIGPANPSESRALQQNASDPNRTETYLRAPSRPLKALVQADGMCSGRGREELARRELHYGVGQVLGAAYPIEGLGA